MTDRDTIIGSYVHDRDSSTKQAPKFMTQPAVLSGLQVQGEAMRATKKSDAASGGWGQSRYWQ